MSTTLAVLSPQDIKNRVETSNSFTKAEMVAHKAQIVDARAAKRLRLSTVTGSQLGTIVEQYQKTEGAVVRDIRHTTSAKQQTWTIKLVAKVYKTEAEQLAAKVKAAGVKLAKLEEEYEKARAVPVETKKA